MKYEKLIFIYPFPIGSFLNAKVGLEATLEDGDNVDECFERLRRETKALADKERGIQKVSDEEFDAALKQFHNESIQIREQPEERQIGLTEEALRSCDSLGVLQTYRIVIKRHPDLQPVYDEMLKKLSTKPTKETNLKNK